MAVPDPILDEINLTTLPEINDLCIEDLFFLGSPLQAHLRSKCMVPFKGGAFTRNVFSYNPLNAGAYAKGVGGFNLTKPNTLGGTVFDPRYYCCMIIEYLEDLHVLNTGPLAVFSLLETDMANAVLTMSVLMALDIQQNGQVAPRTININGWVEAINDGIVPSYDGNVYTNYGTAPRNGTVRKALNGNVYWAGNADGTLGAIDFPQMNAAYNLCRRGPIEPDLFCANKPFVSFIENRMQVQQRLGQDSASVRDPYFGATGWKFKNAIVLQDDYFPSSFTSFADATNAGLGGNLTTTISYTAPSGTPPNNFPLAANLATASTLSVGEVGVFFNTRQIKFRVSNSEEFGFNPTPFIRDLPTTRVGSQLKAAVNMEFTAPWGNCQMYGIGS